MKPSLRALTVGFLAAFLLATAGTGLATYRLTLGTIDRLVDRRIENVSALVAADGARATAPVLLARIATLARRRDTGDIGFQLTDAAGRRLGGNVTLTRHFAPGYADVRRRDRIQGLSAGRAFTRPVGNGLTLTTIAETEPFDGYRGARRYIYLLGYSLIVVIVLGGLVAFGRTIARRFAETRRTVDAIIAGDMQQRIAVTGSADEFDRQAHAFNRMLDRIAELMDGLRNVSNDVAHDLRTPLARLRSRLATIAARADARTRDEVEQAIGECDAILAMVGAMLRIAEIESGRRTAGFTRVDLAALVAEIGEAMAPVAEDSGHDLVVAAGEAAAITGDPRLIEQALLNGIENALRHTPAGTRVTLGVAVADGCVWVRIGDDGPGIPADQRELALRRFGRLEASRNRPGHGLGLPLIAAIMRLHGGVLRLEDGEPGLVLGLAFPLGSADQNLTDASRP
ncbi:sensor histidine kinase [Sphingomonas melonis]|uniref:histidine kinase n=1 Tax=Sphingomonas melonis TaxID=152682 RepID=A0A7Y9K389_9SPHN|nr:ATP-binding protein [Sphingomonas melonis]NYD91836.1 signal transduction histidine kinase [Sphingomonas melonis]